MACARDETVCVCIRDTTSNAHDRGHYIRWAQHRRCLDVSNNYTTSNAHDQGHYDGHSTAAVWLCRILQDLERARSIKEHYNGQTQNTMLSARRRLLSSLADTMTRLERIRRGVQLTLATYTTHFRAQTSSALRRIAFAKNPCLYRK